MPFFFLTTNLFPASQSVDKNRSSLRRAIESAAVYVDRFLQESDLITFVRTHVINYLLLDRAESWIAGCLTNSGSTRNQLKECGGHDEGPGGTSGGDGLTENWCHSK